MKNLIKYLLYSFTYLATTVIIAFVILAETIPDDGQCHAMQRPLLIHYILAFIVTGLPFLIYIYTIKNKRRIINKYDR